MIKCKKWFLSVLVVSLLLVFFGVLCNAEEAGTVPKVYLNGKQIEFDVAPYVESNRIFVPIRTVSESLKYDVLWNGEDQSVRITDGMKTVILYLGKVEYTDNGEIRISDVAPKAISGRTLVPIRLISESFGCNVDWKNEEYSAYITSCNTVEAKNAHELLSAVANDTRIVLTGSEYNFSEVDFSTIINEHITFGEFCEDEVVIQGVKNLIIEGAPGNNPQLVTESAYANVLCFSGCTKIGLINFTAGHKVEKGTCIGGVIKFLESRYSYVENCRLYGCGTYGITTEYSDNIDISNTEIYECTYGAVSLYHSRDIEFDNCIFRDCREFSIFDYVSCENIMVANSVIKNNISGEYSALISSYESKNAEFNNCVFEANSAANFTDGDGIIINNSSIK